MSRLAIDPKKFPTNLSAGRSDFQVLCDELGGPEPLANSMGIEVPERELWNVLERTCRKFPFYATWATFREWCPDEKRAKRYWPWVAYTAHFYEFERREKRGYEKELQPGQVPKLLARISANARKICNDMALLQELSNRLDDPRVPDRRGHLGWIDEYLAQSITFGTRPDIDDDDEIMMLADLGRRKLIKQLVALDLAATAAKDRVTPELLKRRTANKELGVCNLVYRAKIIWESLTERAASAARVRPRPDVHPTHATEDLSDFVFFVSAIGTMATGHDTLTSDQIATALGP